MSLLGSRAVFTPTLLACYAITAAVHVASIVLNTLLPLHVADLGGTKTQVGLLFSVMTVVSMFLRPTVGGWVDRFGARPVIAPGIAALALTTLGAAARGDAGHDHRAHDRPRRRQRPHQHARERADGAEQPRRASRRSARDLLPGELTRRRHRSAAGLWFARRRRHAAGVRDSHGDGGAARAGRGALAVGGRASRGERTSPAADQPVG